MKTSLGIWAFGPMVTRFVPGGYQPDHAAETTPERVVRDALDGHGIYAIATGTHLNPRFGKGALSSPDDAIRRDALAEALRAAEFAGEIEAQMILWPGIE